MQTIRIDVKDRYVDMILNMLDALQNVMIERIDIVSEDSAYQRDKARLRRTLDDYQNNGSEHFTPIDRVYWDDVRSRLVERHTGQ